MAKPKGKRMGSARAKGRGQSKKAQSAIEYLLTYSWAILLVALVVAILYLFIFSPQSIVPSSCSFLQGAFCHDLVFGSSSSSSQIAMLFTNDQKFPIANPSFIVNISKIGSITGTCAPSYVLAGGAMICTLSLPSTALSLGSLVSGNMYLSAIPCPSANEAACQSGTAQTYVGGFNTHVSPILSSTNTLVALTVQNSTQAASGIKDKLTANVKLLGYPVQGATVSFTSNSAAATIYPATITTDADGNAVSYISDSQAEDVKVTATFAGSTANTVISFVPAVYIDVETTSMSGVSSPLYSFDGQQYTTNHVFSVNPGSSHSFSFNSLLLNGAGDTQYLYSSTIGCGETSQNGNVIASLNCTLLGSYQTQYYLTMGANPAAGALSVSPASGFYNAGNAQTISETPNPPSYNFTGWIGSGSGTSYSGSSPSYALVIDGPMSENAQYNAQPLYTFATTSLFGNTAAIGTYVTIDTVGMPYNGASFQSYWSPNSTHTYSYPSTISGGTDVEYTYNGIKASDCGQTLQTNSLTVGSVNCQTTASYNTLFQLTMETSGTGSGTISPVAGSTWQQSGNSITITASPATNNYFAGWIGTGTNAYSGSTANPSAFTITTPITENAVFNAYPVYTFTASSMSSTTANVVTIDGTGYTRAELPVSFHTWAPGSTHTYSYASPISAGTYSQYVYSSTSGCSQTAQSATLTVGTSSCTVTGSYTLNTAPTITFTASSMSSTTANVVTIDGTGYTRAELPVSFQAWAGTSITYSYASPISGSTGTRYVYSSTSGCSQTTQSATFSSPSSSCTVTGSYTTQYLLTLDLTSSGGGLLAIGSSGSSFSSTVTQWYASSSTVSITINASAYTGRDFYAWKQGSTLISTSKLYTFTGMTAPKTYTAYFYDIYTFGGSSMLGTGSNVMMTINGVTYPANTTLNARFLPGTSFTYSYSSTVSVNSNERYSYSSTSSDCGTGFTSQSGTVTASSSSLFSGCVTTGYYNHQYYASLSVAPSGYGTISSSGWHNAGSSVSISASANSGYKFFGLEGFGTVGYTGYATSVSITANGYIDEIAVFGKFSGSDTYGDATKSVTLSTSYYNICGAYVENGGTPTYNWADTYGNGAVSMIGRLSSGSTCTITPATTGSTPTVVLGGVGMDSGSAYSATSAGSWPSISGSGSVSYTIPASYTGPVVLISTACSDSTSGSSCSFTWPTGCTQAYYSGSVGSYAGSGSTYAVGGAYCVGQNQGSTYSVGITLSNSGSGTANVGAFILAMLKTTTSTSTASTTSTSVGSTSTTVSGGGGSFVGDTPILMANGQYKQIKDIKPGDVVLSYNLKTGKMFPNIITNAYSFPVSVIYTINNSTVTDGKEMLYTKNGWMSVSDLKVGDYAFNTKTGSYIRIDSLVKSTGNVVVYDLIGSSSNNFIVKDGLLTDIYLLLIPTSS